VISVDFESGAAIERIFYQLFVQQKIKNSNIGEMRAGACNIGHIRRVVPLGVASCCLLFRSFFIKINQNLCPPKYTARCGTPLPASENLLTLRSELAIGFTRSR
jgi:hypothetical protein